MGDTGSLMLGGVIAVLAIILRKELLIPVLCGVFLIELVSVMLQVAYFKYTKKIWRRKKNFPDVSITSPLSEKSYHESKIVNRFMIIGIMLAVICLITLKVR